MGFFYKEETENNLCSSLSLIKKKIIICNKNYTEFFTQKSNSKALELLPK